MRKISGHLEDVWGIYAELKEALGDQYSDDKLLVSANRLIEVAKGKIAREKTQGRETNAYAGSCTDTYTMMMSRPKRETVRAMDDFCDYEDDDYAINFPAIRSKFKAFGIGA